MKHRANETRAELQALQKRLRQLARERWARRAIRVVLRSLAFCLSILSLGVGLHLAELWTMDVWVLGSVALACLVIGLLFLLQPMLKPYEVAERLDRRFNLHEQLVTALEVGAGRRTEGVAAHLLAHAERTSLQVYHHIWDQLRFPWPELGTVVGFLLLLGGLILMVDLQGFEMANSAASLPSLVPPDPLAHEELPPEPQNQDQQQQPDGSGMGDGAQPEMNPNASSGGSTQQALAAIADALRDQAATRPAADRLDQNNVGAAAQELRSLADRAGEIAPQSRNAIASALTEAANEIIDNIPLSDQLRRSAYGMQQGDAATADALEDLADALESLGGEQHAGLSPDSSGTTPQDRQPGDQPGSGGSGAGNIDSIDQRELERPSERLGVEGVPLELDKEGQGNVPDPEPSPEDSPTGSTPSAGFERGSPPEYTDMSHLGSDPLRIPADLRHVVQEYFSPAN